MGFGEGGNVMDQEIILIGRAIDGLVEVREILKVLLSRGTLPESWEEIASVMDSIRAELSDMEKSLMRNAIPSGAREW
jgi:hypothetical protein